MSAGRRQVTAILILTAITTAQPLLAASRAATAIRDAAALRRNLHYDEAAARLDAAIPELQGDERARALIARAALATDSGDARDFLLDAGRAATTADARRRADLELAQLDLARGSYRGVQTRLTPYASDPSAALLLGLAAIGLELHGTLDSLLAPAGDDDTAQLLRGWDALQRGEPRQALARLEPLAARRSSHVLPTALLWKATAEAQLGDAAAAARTSAELRTRFGAAPETDAAARAAQAPPTAPETATHSDRVALQIAAFEDRANALRYRDTVAASLPAVRVEAAEVEGRTIYRVCVGDFASRDDAEAFARAQLDRRDLAWQVVRWAPERR